MEAPVLPLVTKDDSRCCTARRSHRTKKTHTKSTRQIPLELRTETLVGMRAVLPDLSLHVDVNRPQHARLARSAARPKLEIDHGPNLRSDKWLDGRDAFFWDGLDWLSLDCFSDSQSFDGTQRAPGRLRHEFMCDAPFKHTANTGHMLVDSLPADASVDQLLATCHQGKRAKVGRRHPTVESSDRS